MNNAALASKKFDNVIQFPLTPNGDNLREAPKTDQPTKLDRLTGAYILPMREDVARKDIDEHKAEPIKSLDDINRVCSYLLEAGRYRDYMLFVVGINFGLRVSDLLRLRFCDLINEDLTFKDSFTILEVKTTKTRKVKKNRYVGINAAARQAINTYLAHTPDVCLSDYLFRSESPYRYSKKKNAAGTAYEDAPLTRMSVDRILKDIADKCGLTCKVSTHTLRKTFGYHQMVMSGNSSRKLVLLQKIFGHSSVEMTLEYIGVTRDEIDEAYQEMNLGSAQCYELAETTVYEIKN